MESSRPHDPVLLEEVMEYLSVKEGGSYIDCTAGAGGHMARIAELAGPAGFVLGCDIDREAVALCLSHLQELSSKGSVARFSVRNSSYLELPRLASELPARAADGVLLDFGCSSIQLDSVERGFSFRSDNPLDMRFDPNSGTPTAADLLETLSESELADIFHFYGEERRARALARKVVQERACSPIRTTGQFKQLVESVVGARSGGHAGATRAFQALRICVNAELSNVEAVLPMAFDVLKPGGTVVAISFHSLEDRIVKNSFRRLDALGSAKILTRKPVTASLPELRRNPRSRSAKLRAVRKV